MYNYVLFVKRCMEKGSLAWFPAAVIDRRLGTKHHVIVTSADVPLRVLYSAAEAS